MRRIARPLPAVLLLLALIGIWELYVDLHGATFSLVLPAPHAVVAIEMIAKVICLIAVPMSARASIWLPRFLHRRRARGHAYAAVGRNTTQ